MAASAFHCVKPVMALLHRHPFSDNNLRVLGIRLLMMPTSNA